ncbi:Phosphatidylserine lipase ABHD16A like protein [Argiope bruennichi]|uniref:Phosphatidylserine lipase ABHD16A like protein n=2 Tax=Argiope bruennichi TaxID=94029 RepID=A0A8T0G279_ARGBR|nr:Phosphatidylserine lipase ABHD16A like protein [Argiope bruennichi]
MAWSLGFYTSPLLASFMYRRGYFTTEGMVTLYRLSSTVGILIFFSMFIRGLGRMMNSDYLTFIASLDAYKQHRTRDLKYQIGQYDFDFREWPVDFRWNEGMIDASKPKIYLNKGAERDGILSKLMALPCDILSYIAIHTFGRMMIYPGSIGLLNTFLSPILLKGRSKLVEEHNGERFKLLTEDGNEIDSMFVDRRNNPQFNNGNILVICCEGNAGFYEYGITGTPIEAGYSVLGWNHPGFAYSTGLPFPSQELKAMDVVMQFALTKLGFKMENVVLYAWSIGGFSATWAAMNYPDVKGLVLDATFDDLVTLAIPRMPVSWKPLVVRTIRTYMNLNNAEQLCKYPGPVILIRRTKDEIISTKASRSIQTNRGNDLLIKLLQTRYPNLVNNDTLWALKEWLAGDKNHQSVLWSQQGVEEDLCNATIMSYIEENGADFPLMIGEHMSSDMKVQLVLYLAEKYMVDFDSTHCVPLPGRAFQLPWDFSRLSINGSSSEQQSHI